MPRVPDIRRQVAPDALPTVRQRVDAPVGAFGRQGGPLPDLSAPTKLLAGIVDEEREKADQIAVTAFDNKLAEHERAARERLRSARGLEAMAAVDREHEAWDTIAGELATEARGDRQKMALAQRVAARRNQFAASATEYAATERRRYDDDETDKALSNRLDAAAASVDLAPALATAARTAAVTEARGIAILYAERNALGPAARAAFVDGAVSKVHAAAIAAMLARGNEVEADAYLTEHRGELRGAERTEADRVVGAAAREGAGARLAASVWAEMGPKALNDPLRQRALEDAVRAKLGDDPDARTLKAALADISTRAAAHQVEQAEVTAANRATVFGAYNDGAPLLALRRMPAYLALDGAKQLEITEHVLQQTRVRAEGAEAAEDRRATRAERAESRAERALQRKHFSEFAVISAPEVLQNLTEPMILGMQARLGFEYTTRLITMRRSLDTADGRRAATISEDLYLQGARALGLVKQKPTDEERAALGEFKTFVLDEIDAVQRRETRTLTRDEKATLVRGLTRTWWVEKPLARDQQVQEYRLRTDPEMQTETQDRLAVPLADIPADRIAAMTEIIRGQGGALDEPKLTSKLQRMRAAKLRNDDASYLRIAGER